MIIVRFTLSCDFCRRVVREETKSSDFYCDESIAREDDLIMADMTEIKRKGSNDQYYTHWGEIDLCPECYNQWLIGEM